MRESSTCLCNQAKSFYKRQVIVFIAILTILGYHTLAAQDNQTQNRREDDTKSVHKAQPTFISVSDIALSSEKDLLRLTKIKKEIEPTSEIIEFEERLPAVLKDIKEAQEATAIIEISTISERKLEDLKQNRLQQSENLEGFKQTLGGRIDLLESINLELLQISNLWEETKKNAHKEDVPVALRRRIETLLKSLNAIQNTLDQMLNSQLIAQNQISDTELKLIEELTRFDNALLQKKHELFRINSQPLWKISVSAKDSTTLNSELKTVTNKKRIAFIVYFTENLPTLFLHFLIFIILLAILISLHWKSRQWANKEETSKTTLHILKRPAATALLLTLSLTRIIHPHAPVSVYDLNSLLVLFPLIRLLFGLVAKNMRLPLYFLTIIYILHQIQIGLSGNLLLERLFLLFTIILTASGLAWMVRPRSVAVKIGKGRIWKAVLALSRLAILILIAALVANIIGSTKLSELLTHGTLYSLYLAIVIYTIVLIINGILLLFLQAKVVHSLKTVHKHYELLKARSTTYLNFIALIIWALWTLSLFNIYTPIAAFVTGMITVPWSVGSLSISLGDIIAFGLTIWISILVSKVIRFFLEEDVLPHLKLPRGVPGSISMLTHYLILIFGFIIAMSAAGIEWSRLALLAGALGVGIGFGLQDVVNNFVSGLILIFERPIKLRDVVEVGGLMGVVKRIGIRSSTIRTYEGAEVIVPNGHLVSSDVTNWTLSDKQRRVTVAVGVAYGTDPKKVINILREIAEKHPDIRESPAPNVLFSGFGDSSLDFELRFWANNFDEWLQLKTDITVAVNEALKQAKIEIPFPQRDLHIISKQAKADANEAK